MQDKADSCLKLAQASWSDQLLRQWSGRDLSIADSEYCWLTWRNAKICESGMLWFAFGNHWPEWCNHDMHSFQGIGDKHDYLVLELLDYCERRQCTFDMNSWNKIIFMLKCINKFNIRELESLGDKLLNKMKSEYKSLATEDRSQGLKVKKVSKASKPWRIKDYQTTFDVYLEDDLDDLNKELISWISEWNNILFSDVSNWKVVFDEVILDMNKYLQVGIILFGVESKEIILSSNLKIISYINRINKINISEFYEKKRTRKVGLLYDLLIKTNSMRILENKINKFSLKDCPLLHMLDELLSVTDINLTDIQITIEKALVDYELNFLRNILVIVVIKLKLLIKNMKIY
jgi:hypothetical protein